jgi:cytochrome c553
MKKIMFVLLAVVVFASLAMAQVAQGTQAMTSGPAGAVAPTIDVLGAHNNYGRGCAGCHAPHSGAKGAGGNAIASQTTDPYTGVNALFAQDMGPLYNKTFDFSDISNTGSSNKYTFTSPSGMNPASWTAQQYSDVRGILMCLACHDGAVAKGAMMQNWSYEQQIGALPTSYGGGKIPTLLGSDGTYNNDHPVGENATLDKALGSYCIGAGSGCKGTTDGLTFVITGTSITSVTPTGVYQNFMNSYGAPAIMKGAYAYPTPVNASGSPYLVCTTCHDQHSMNVYAASANSPINGQPTGTYAKFFFVNGPYNVNNVNVPPTKAPSTTQFCRQCHFGESNEANGGSLSTAF